MEFIARDDVEFKTVRYLHTYDLILPRPLADWDVWEYWEHQRIESMRTHLTHGMVLFDVGTESGWCNLVYATFVGPENMVLIEPTAEFWPNIQATWNANMECLPLACYDGLASDVTTDTRKEFRRWPAHADGPLIDRNKYQYIHEHSEDVAQMRLDDLVACTDITPDALTMDVEGAELLVLQGASDTLANHRPLLWISIHPDLGERDYGNTAGQVHDYLTSHGYTGTHLGTDHEEHWFFEPA